MKWSQQQRKTRKSTRFNFASFFFIHFKEYENLFIQLWQFRLSYFVLAESAYRLSNNMKTQNFWFDFDTLLLFIERISNMFSSLSTALWYFYTRNEHTIRQSNSISNAKKSNEEERQTDRYIFRASFIIEETSTHDSEYKETEPPLTVAVRWTAKHHVSVASTCHVFVSISTRHHWLQYDLYL